MTAINERARFRIESLVADADYRSAAEATADAANIALLSADPAAAKEREAARSAAVREANARRGTTSAPGRETGLGHRVASISAMVLGALAVGLVALSPRTGSAAFTLQQGALVAGAIAAVAVSVMIWLEPRRASGELWGTHLPSRIHLFFGVVWIGFAGSVLVFRSGEIDRYEPWPVIIGLVLFFAAGVAALVLWGKGRSADRTGGQSGRAHVLRGLADLDDAPAVFDALDRWWAVAGARAMADDPERLLAARREVLAFLARSGLIDPAQEREAARVAAIREWKERRP